MKIPMPEDDLIPEPEFDEFGDRIIRPIVAYEEISPEGARLQYLKNHAEYVAYTKQVSRNRDARMLERGEIDQAGLNAKNSIFASLDFSKVRIVSIGGKRYEEID